MTSDPYWSRWQPARVGDGAQTPSANYSPLIQALDGLRLNQWGDSAVLERGQLAALGRVAAWAHQHNAFWRHRLDQAGFRPDQPITRAMLQAVPVLKRQEIATAGVNAVLDILPKSCGDIFKITTSGSTGEPLTVYKTREAETFSRLAQLRLHEWYGHDLTGVWAAILHNPTAPAPQGIIAPSWNAATANFVQTGPGIALDIRAPLNQQVEWLIQHDPDYLVTYPSNLAALLDLFDQAKTRLARLKSIRCQGETVTPALRQRCRQVLGVEIVNLYACHELGCLALPCPEHGTLHVNSEAVLVEILDEGDRPCLPGTEGRVIVTGLRNVLMPLIRYDIGDRGALAAPCGCGRGYPALAPVLGRRRNMLVLPDGQLRWPSFSFADRTGLESIRQFQIIQDGATHLTVRMSVQGATNKYMERRFSEELAKSLTFPFHTTYVYFDEIGLGPSAKFEDFICALAH